LVVTQYNHPERAAFQRREPHDEACDGLMEASKLDPSRLLRTVVERRAETLDELMEAFWITSPRIDESASIGDDRVNHGAGGVDRHRIASIVTSFVK
jgi:hypothetical protein